MILQSKPAEKELCLFFYRGKKKGLICGDCPLHNSSDVLEIKAVVAGCPHFINQPATF